MFWLAATVALAEVDGVYAARFLFDANHGESAGNADWVIDADLQNILWNSSGTFDFSGNESNAQRIPTPPASGITSNTPETYWSGAISAWAVDLVKRGHSVESLPTGATLTWNTSNAQDLTNYDVVVIDEPNVLFAMSEKQALINFVANGGSLFMISDHVNSDRNSDGWDSVGIWNDFLTNNGLTNNPFGITFRTTGSGSNSSGNNTFNHNIVGDPILNGPVGVATNCAYFNGNEFQIDNTKNPTVLSHMWFGLVSDSNNFCAVASLRYGNGRVAVAGDSSMFDDGSGDPNDSSLFDGYTTDAGGVQHIWILNASEWLVPSFTVTPSTGFSANGTAGGPFSPSNQVYTLSNNGSISIDWTASKTATWLNLSTVSGSLPGGSSIAVTVSLASTAYSLPVGTYSDTLGFTNMTNGVGNANRPVSLNVFTTAGFFDDMENGTNGWTAFGQWHMVGTGACSNWYSPTHSWYYGQDATCSYYTGSSSTGFLTTPTFLVPTNALLVYWSWEQQNTTYDYHYVAISTDNWVTWNFISVASSTYPSWHAVTNDLSTFAGKAAQLRFVFYVGQTFASFQGWYIDDVRVATTTSLLEVTPATNVTSLGPVGGAFVPASQIYTLMNATAGALNWSASASANWLSLSVTNGTLSGQATVNVTATINGAANALGEGSYSNLVTFVNETNGNGTTNLIWTLLVSNPQLLVTPITDLTTNGPQGGPFSISQVYTLMNTNAVPLNWAATPSDSWLSISPASGALSGGANVPVTVTVNANANALAGGPHTNLVSFVNSTNGRGTTNVLWILFVDVGVLSVSPNTEFNASGNQGGPFSPFAQQYVLTNSGKAQLSWSASVSNNWLTLSAPGGILPIGQSSTFTAAINTTVAQTLPGGLYSNVVNFVNGSNGSGTTYRVATLLVRDGIPDAWRLQYFGHVEPRASDLSRAGDDSDGDGYNNLQEYSDGTNPTNSASHPTGFPPNLLAWWRFDENLGATAGDSSLNSNTGSISGSGSWYWTSGMFATALYFGAPTQVAVSNSASLNPVQGVTVSAWVNADYWSNNQRILEKGKSNNQYALFVNPSGQLVFAVYGVTGGTAVTTPPLEMAWHHVAGTYDGSLISLYVDGQVVTQQTASGQMPITADPLAIGFKPGGNILYYFNGVIDDVRIYGRALSAAEIVQLHNADSIGDGIANWWRRQYFGSSSTTDAFSCAACDATGTGQKNLFKYVAGLDPANPASIFILKIAKVTGQPTQKNVLFNPIANGRTYTVESRTNLVSGSYAALFTFIGPTTNGNQVTVTDTNAVGPRKFYRIKITYP